MLVRIITEAAEVSTRHMPNASSTRYRMSQQGRLLIGVSYFIHISSSAEVKCVQLHGDWTKHCRRVAVRSKRCVTELSVSSVSCLPNIELATASSPNTPK
jgi:hypothetical protein